MGRILIIIFISCASLKNLFAQEAYQLISKNYFRSDPFTGSFSGFLHHLLNDPGIRDKHVEKKSDTSFFYFSGNYEKHNPFFFKPKQVSVQLREIPVEYGDSLVTDTVFSYEILAFVNADETGERDIKKEFEKLHRQFNRKFFRSNFQPITEEDAIIGGLYNYFVSYSNLSPATLSWGRVENEFVLEITLRLKSSANKAVLAASLYHPQ